MSNLSVVFMPHPPIIIPEIGGGKEIEAKETINGMHQLGRLISELKPETIIFITPHGNSFRNGTCILDANKLNGDFSPFGFPQIKCEKRVNQDLTDALYQSFESEDFVTVLMDEKLAKQYKVKVSLDHGVMVPMFFIDKYYSDYDIVHITPGFTPLEENYKLGQHIQSVTKDKNVLLICSGDMSHALNDSGPYNYHPSGTVFDKAVEQAIINSDPIALMSLDNQVIEEAAQCGLSSFIMGFGYLDGIGYESEVLSYEGPFGVGYLTGYLKKNESKQNNSLLEEIDHLSIDAYENRKLDEDDYIKLARQSIEAYVKDNRKLDFEKVKDEYSKKFIDEVSKKCAGAFVSIHKNGLLRGCIGTIEPTQESLIDEIIYNGISACSRDPRFNVIEPNELMDLDIKVDVLEKPERISSKDELDVIKYGVIVEKGMNRGLLLPNLEGVDTVEQQVTIAMEKAGILDDEGMKLYRFEVIRHER